MIARRHFASSRNCRLFLPLSKRCGRPVHLTIRSGRIEPWCGMAKILALLIVALMVAHLIRPFGLPGLKRRGVLEDLAGRACRFRAVSCAQPFRLSSFSGYPWQGARPRCGSLPARRGSRPRQSLTDPSPQGAARRSARARYKRCAKRIEGHGAAFSMRASMGGKAGMVRVDDRRPDDAGGETAP